MKTRPIIFQPEMVKAILDGRKTMTRRVIKPQPYILTGTQPDEWPDEYPELCPYGVPGDRLWVRETLAESSVGSEGTHKAGYLASLPTEPGDKYDLRFYPDAAVRKDGKLVDWWDVVKRKRKDKKPSPTLPSIFMPKWVSRLTLEITNVRVERVQDISYQDAISEGINDVEYSSLSNCCGLWVGNKYISNEDPENVFMYLWDKMHKKRGFGWSENPWVWVVEFKKVEK